MTRGGIGAHQAAVNVTPVWLTPRHVLDALGAFDLDPCAAPEPRPWQTAATHLVEAQDGLTAPWRGRVWLNPPYGGPAIVTPWLKRMADHGHGTALIFARTETAAFHTYVWRRATALLFLQGRLTFCRPDGTPAAANGGAPSVLIAYGDADARQLLVCGLPGAFVRLTD